MRNKSKLKVLHLPYNVASSTSITVSELNKDERIDARGVVFGAKHLYTSADNIKYYDLKGRTFGLYTFFIIFILIKNFLWADIIHWYWGSFLPYQLDLKIIKIINKPLFIQWHGSDIRIPEIAMKDNPFYKYVYENKTYEYFNLENKTQSIKRQYSFSKINAIPIVYPELGLNIQKELFNRVVNIRHRILLDTIKPFYPSKDTKTPKIIHVSSKNYAKGTNHICTVLEELKNQINFEYCIVTNKDRDSVLKLVSECDIFLDQFIIGEYGLAAVEAMAYGKPVVSFIRQDVLNLLPNDMPIIVTDLENLKATIIKLINDSLLRNSIGIKSRKYVEKYHDSKKVISILIEEYFKEYNI